VTILPLLLADWIGLFDIGLFDIGLFDGRGGEAVSFPCHEVIEPFGGEVNRRTRPTGGHLVREWNVKGLKESPGADFSRI
jgi:hypothetical protein